MQFLKSGLEQEEKAVYVTVDERPAEILQAADSLGWDLQQYVQAKSFAILDASPYFSGRAGTVGDKGVDLQKIVSDLATYAKKLEATRLVIDPVTPLILSGDSPTRVQEHAQDVDSLAAIQSCHDKPYHLAPSAAGKPRPHQWD